MSYTLTIQDTINWCQPYLKQQPLNVNNMEPGLGIANVVKETMLGSPLRWRTNRNNLQIALNKGQVDYPLHQLDFGYMETAWIRDLAGKIFQLNGAISLAQTTDQGRPGEIAPQYDDGDGSITWRVKIAPNTTYTAFIDYQKRVERITSFAMLWGIPDEHSYMFNFGYLAIASMLVNDPRFAVWERYFLGRVLGAQDGLDEQAKLIFLGQWNAATATLTRNAASVNQAGNLRAQS